MISDFLPILLYIIKVHNIYNFTFVIIINCILNCIFKQIIREPRPNYEINNTKYDTYGMPSGHAQVVWFMVFYNLRNTSDRKTTLLVLLAIATCTQRIYTKRHTLEQVIIGSFLGSMLGFSGTNIKSIANI